MNSLKKAFLSAAVLLAAAGAVSAEPVQLSAVSQAYLVTLDPGTEVYFAFGHTGLRIVDPVNNIDYLYNFGVMPDMPRLKFVAAFLKGDMEYEVIRTPYLANVSWDMRQQHRVWYEQELLLTQEEKEQLYSQLEDAVQPQNCVFQYDFVLSNCATKERDQLDEVFKKTGGILSYTHPDYKNETYRSLINDCLADRPVSRLAINLLLGDAADVPLNPRKAMFLPGCLKECVATATVTRGCFTKPLARSAAVASDPDTALVNQPEPRRAFPLLWVAALLVLLAVAADFYTDKKWCRICDSVIFGLASLFGLLIYVLTMFSANAACAGNYNWIWFNPLYLVLCWVPLLPLNREFAKWLFCVSSVLSLSGVVYFLCCTGPVCAAFFLPLILLIRAASELYTRLIRRQ